MNPRRFCLFACLLVAVLAPLASAQSIDWIRQFGSTSFDQATGVSVDPSGVYVAGLTNGALPGQSHAGAMDAFVRKYDANGTEQWTRQFGTGGNDLNNAIAVDASGVYVTGHLNGDGLVRKYDGNGTEQWTRLFGNPGASNVMAVSLGASGVYVAGVVHGVALPGQTALGDSDCFVRKYDANGTEQWTRQFGTPSSETASAVSVDASGIYVSGVVHAALPGQTHSGDGDAFVRKYDVNGTEQWTRQFGTAGDDRATGISVDGSGVYLSGFTDGTLPSQSSAGSRDVFVRKYDTNGAEQWTHQFGTPSSDSADSKGVAAGISGVYVAGHTGGVLGQSSAGSIDAFVRMYDANGNELWTHQFGTSGDDQAFPVAADAFAIYVGGWTGGTLPGNVSAGDFDVFLVKLVAAQAADQAIEQLITGVVALNLQQGISNSLDSKLDAALQAMEDVNQNNNVSAINKLQAFINAVEGQRGVHITDAQADALVGAASQIIGMLSA
ncbi:MAG: hypothetical protein L0387_33750 [Acidobacteria bacterium]|nr:hypothetical protein [Acidobacteriota bacterium]